MENQTENKFKEKQPVLEKSIELHRCGKRLLKINFGQWRKKEKCLNYVFPVKSI